MDSGIAPERDSIQKVTSSSPLSGVFSAGIKQVSIDPVFILCFFPSAGN